MSEEQEDAEMSEDRQSEEEAGNSKYQRKRGKLEKEPAEVVEEYNYLNDESAIRVGGDGGITPPYSEDKNMKQASPEDEEFPEDDVDPIIYMALTNRKKWLNIY